jgi:hypothetical protein
LWKKTEPLLLAAIGYGLDINEADIRAFIQILKRIQIQPIETAEDMISRLPIEEGTSKIIPILSSDEIAKKLTSYILDIVDRILRKERVDKNIELLKSIIDANI